MPNERLAPIISGQQRHDSPSISTMDGLASQAGYLRRVTSHLPPRLAHSLPASAPLLSRECQRLHYGDMAIEWVGTAITGAVGVAGIVGTYVGARSQSECPVVGSRGR